MSSLGLRVAAPRSPKPQPSADASLSPEAAAVLHRLLTGRNHVAGVVTGATPSDPVMKAGTVGQSAPPEPAPRGRMARAWSWLLSKAEQLSLFGGGHQVQRPGIRGGHYRVTPKGDVRYDQAPTHANRTPTHQANPWEGAAAVAVEDLESTALLDEFRKHDRYFRGNTADDPYRDARLGRLSAIRREAHARGLELAPAPADPPALTYDPATAKRLRAKADALAGRSHAMIERIPFGQPIHSVRDRNLRERSAELMRRAVALVKQAEAIEALAPPPTPAEQYQAQGTRAPLFKAWFGDWENDPASASKVVDANGEPQETYNASPRVLYHGTAHGGFSEFDPSKLDAEALFGPGFYFTDNQNVAGGYTTKGVTGYTQATPAAVDAVVRFIRKNLPKPYTARPIAGEEHLTAGTATWTVRRDKRRIFNLSGGPHHELVSFRLVKTWKGSAREDISVAIDNEYLSDVAFEAIPDRLGWDARQRSQWESIAKWYKWDPAARKPEVKACYLNIRNPFDGDEGLVERAAIPDEFLNRYPALRSEPSVAARDPDMPQRVRPSPIVRLSYNALFAVMQSRRDVNELLQALGYDGITHIGGRLVGHQEHRVWIAFKPTQIKAVDNVGTFDPSTPDITKAYAVDRHGRIMAKAHVKQYVRASKLTGQQTVVREHDDRRMSARPRPGLKRPIARQQPSHPRARAMARPQPQPHRMATIHTAGPTSPGHAVRMQPHPEKPGVWQVHPDDKKRAAELLAAKQPAERVAAKPSAKASPSSKPPAPKLADHLDHEDPEAARTHRKALLATTPMPTSLPDDPGKYFLLDKPGTKVVPLDKLKPIRAREQGLENAPKYMHMALTGKIPRRKPLSLIDNKDGTYTVADGNSTYATAKKYGWKGLPGIVDANAQLEEHGAPLAAGADRSTSEPMQPDELCKRIGGCDEDPALPGYRVPKNIGLLAKTFHRALRSIAAKLGDVGDDPAKAPTMRNGARTSVDLHADAKAVEPTLREIIDQAAATSGGEANYGPGGKFSLKTHSSMASKVERMLGANSNLTESDALQKIGDAVRGTVIVDNTDQMRTAIEHLKANGAHHGVKLFVDNKFRDPNQVRKGGYAAVHCDVEFKAPSGRTVRGEIQFQLRSVHDGTEKSIKEGNHALYELGQGREGRRPTPDLKRKVNWAGVFMFTTALAPHIARAARGA